MKSQLPSRKLVSIPASFFRKSTLKLTMKKAKTLPFIFLLSTLLAACDSGISGQIEKCVQAGIAAGGPYKDSTEKSGMEANMRAYCMRAAAGKE